MVEINKEIKYKMKQTGGENEVGHRTNRIKFPLNKKLYTNISEEKKYISLLLC